MKDVVLIGMPGSGKTTVAKLLAPKLHLAMVDLDLEIERELGVSVQKCFELYGEAAFRVKEAELMTRFAGGGCVLALGGGAVKNGAAMRRLQHDGVIIYLRAEPDALAARLKGDSTRPLLAGDPAARLKQLYAERKALYEAFADFTVSTENTPEEIAERIVKELNE